MALLNSTCLLPGRELRAATLIESLIAMVIVMISFSAALMIYVNISKSDNNRQKLRAYLLLNEAAIETKANNAFYDEEIQSETMVIRKSVKSYNPAYSGENPKILLLEAYDKSGKKIADRKELVITQ